MNRIFVANLMETIDPRYNRSCEYRFRVRSHVEFIRQTSSFVFLEEEMLHNQDIFFSRKCELLIRR